MSSQPPMSREDQEREIAAAKASQEKYGHLVGTVVPRDRSEAGQRERAARLANQPRSQATLTGPNAKYVAEYRAEPAYARSMTEDEYVSMRRVDDRLDPLIKAVVDC